MKANVAGPDRSAALHDASRNALLARGPAILGEPGDPNVVSATLCLSAAELDEHWAAHAKVPAGAEASPAKFPSFFDPPPAPRAEPAPAPEPAAAEPADEELVLHIDDAGTCTAVTAPAPVAPTPLAPDQSAPASTPAPTPAAPRCAARVEAPHTPRPSLFTILRDAMLSPLTHAEPIESVDLAHRALALQPGETVAGVTASGDLLLSLLAAGPAHVIGFDTNGTQTAVARLKAALLGRTDSVGYRSFLGLSPGDRRARLRTWDELAPALGPEAALLPRRDIARGVAESGQARWLAQVVALGLRSCLDDASYRRLLSADSTPEERLAIHDAARRSRNFRLVYAPMLSAGRTAFQHLFFPAALCEGSSYPRRALADLAEVQRPWFAAGLADNPAFGRLLTGRVPTEHERLLYGAEAFGAIARHAAAAEFRTVPIDRGLADLPRHSVDAVYLSNSPDYLRLAGLRALAAAVAHAAKPGARIYYLSLEPGCAFARAGLGTPWRRDDARSDALRQADPVGLYPYLAVGRI